MAYEYETRLKNRLLDLEFDTWEETAQFEREYRELEHVYRKAKAFDEIVIETTGCLMYSASGLEEEEAGRITFGVIQKYEDELDDMEDK